MLQVNEATGGVPAAFTKDTKLLRGSINRIIVNPSKNFLLTSRRCFDETGVNLKGAWALTVDARTLALVNFVTFALVVLLVPWSS